MRTHADADVLLSGLKDHPVNFVVCVQYDEPPKQVDVVEFLQQTLGIILNYVLNCTIFESWTQLVQSSSSYGDFLPLQLAGEGSPEVH